MKTSAEPIFVNCRTGKINKNPRYWVAYVKDEQGNILWSDLGISTKKMALKFADMWIAKQQPKN